jgi:hypothetical protein
VGPGSVRQTSCTAAVVPMLNVRVRHRSWWLRGWTATVHLEYGIGPRAPASARWQSRVGRGHTIPCTSKIEVKWSLIVCCGESTPTYAPGSGCSVPYLPRQTFHRDAVQRATTARGRARLPGHDSLQIKSICLHRNPRLHSTALQAAAPARDDPARTRLELLSPH